MEVIKEGRKARKKEKEKLDKEILRYLLEVNPNITETAKHFGVTKARVTKLANKEAKLNG
jgi:DNA-binding MarR family transcriptional regulator